MESLINEFELRVRKILNSGTFKFEIHKFNAAIMIDIYRKKDLINLTFSKYGYGISIVGENPDFCSIPDESFTEYDLFEKRLIEVLNSNKKNL